MRVFVSCVLSSGHELTNFERQITVQNLRRVSKELGENLGERELQAMIDEFDKNLDGSVSLEEFVVSV